MVGDAHPAKQIVLSREIKKAFILNKMNAFFVIRF